MLEESVNEYGQKQIINNLDKIVAFKDFPKHLRYRQFPYEELTALNRGMDLLFPIKRKGGKNVGHKKIIRKKGRK